MIKLKFSANVRLMETKMNINKNVTTFVRNKVLSVISEKAIYFQRSVQSFR